MLGKPTENTSYNDFIISLAIPIVHFTVLSKTKTVSIVILPYTGTVLGVS